VFCQLKKYMPSRKVAHLQPFGIIHLPKPDLTYIKNPYIEVKLCLCSSTSWKHGSGNLLCYLFLFHPPTYLEITMLTVSHTRIFTRWRLFFPSCQKLSSLLPNYWKSIFNIFPKNQSWQHDLANCWKRSKGVIHVWDRPRSYTPAPLVC
jgi:hypothetical protein